MWQRFTQEARESVFHAQEEAQRLGDQQVRTEHLLLGILKSPETAASKILDTMGVRAVQIRDELDQRLPGPFLGKGSSDLTLDPLAKRAIDLGYREARSLGHNYIGTEHLLLGLLSASSGTAKTVLSEFGLTLDAVRNAVAYSDPSAPSEHRPTLFELFKRRKPV